MHVPGRGVLVCPDGLEYFLQEGINKMQIQKCPGEGVLFFSSHFSGVRLLTGIDQCNFADIVADMEGGIPRDFSEDERLT